MQITFRSSRPLWVLAGKKALFRSIMLPPHAPGGSGLRGRWSQDHPHETILLCYPVPPLDPNSRIAGATS